MPPLPEPQFHPGQWVVETEPSGFSKGFPLQVSEIKVTGFGERYHAYLFGNVWLPESLLALADPQPEPKPEFAAGEFCWVLFKKKVTRMQIAEVRSYIHEKTPDGAFIFRHSYWLNVARRELSAHEVADKIEDKILEEKDLFKTQHLLLESLLS